MLFKKTYCNVVGGSNKEIQKNVARIISEYSEMNREPLGGVSVISKSNGYAYVQTMYSKIPEEVFNSLPYKEEWLEKERQ